MLKRFGKNESNYVHCVPRTYLNFSWRHPGGMSFKSMLLAMEVIFLHSLLSLFFWGVARLELMSQTLVWSWYRMSQTFSLSGRFIFESRWDFAAEWLKNRLINRNVIIQQQLALCLQLQPSFYSIPQQDIEWRVESLWKPYVNCSSSLLPVGYTTVWDVTYALCFHFINIRDLENSSVKILLVGEQWFGLDHFWAWQINLCLHGG